MVGDAVVASSTAALGKQALRLYGRESNSQWLLQHYTSKRVKKSAASVRRS